VQRAAPATLATGFTRTGESFFSARVVTLKIFLIFANTRFLQPGGIFLTPADGFHQTTFKIPSGRPAQLIFQFCAVQRIAAVMRQVPDGVAREEAAACEVCSG
jgi:hypothetical protein